MRLRAARLWVQHDERSANVAFADRKDDPAAYVVLTRELAPDAMRRRLGMDGVYLEINDHASSAWRAATGYAFDGVELRVMVSQAALAGLGLTGDLWIELGEPEMDSDEFRAALAAIFATEP